MNYGGLKSVVVQRAALVERQRLDDVPTKLGLTLQEGRTILEKGLTAFAPWG